MLKTRNGLPRLDLFISLGKMGYADSFSGSFRTMHNSKLNLYLNLYKFTLALNRTNLPKIHGLCYLNKPDLQTKDANP